MRRNAADRNVVAIDRRATKRSCVVDESWTIAESRCESSELREEAFTGRRVDGRGAGRRRPNRSPTPKYEAASSEVAARAAEPGRETSQRRRASSSNWSSKIRTRYPPARSASKNSTTKRSISATRCSTTTPRKPVRAVRRRRSTPRHAVDDRHGEVAANEPGAARSAAGSTGAAVAAPMRPRAALRRRKRRRTRCTTCSRTDVDDEILEIFVEEVARSWSSVDQWLPQWAAELAQRRSARRSPPRVPHAERQRTHRRRQRHRRTGVVDREHAEPRDRRHGRAEPADAAADARSARRGAGSVQSIREAPPRIRQAQSRASWKRPTCSRRADCSTNSATTSRREATAVRFERAPVRGDHRRRAARPI